MKKKLLTVFAALALSQGIQAQVTAYTFTQTTGSYVPVVGGTDLFGAAWNDNVSAAIPLGFTFQFNAVSYSSVTVSSNGFVTFGATAPAATNYLPISTAAAYSGAISAFGRDLSAVTATTGVSYTVTGVSPNRKFTVQWENAKRVTGDVANFQIILNETSNKVDVMFGTCTATSTANTNKVQVGLRGASNTDFNNRFGGNATAWAATTAGTANTDAVNYKSTVLPASGLTLSWLAPSCFPTSGLASTGTTTSTATFTWTSATGTNFDVFYGPTPLTAPNATTAPTATTTATTFTLTGLNPGTGYALYVRNNCGAGNTSTWSPVVSILTPCAPPPILSTTGNSRCGVGTVTLGATTTAGATLNWYTAPTGGAAVASGSVFTTPTISTTTNYYVSAAGGASSFSAGITNAIGATAYTPLDDGLRFNATQPFTINSVDVFPNGAAAALTVQLLNSGGTVLNTYTMNIPAGTGTTPVTVPINFAVTPGTGYYLSSPSPGPAMILNTTGVSYPYAIGTVGSITSGYDGLVDANSATEYFYYFNWQVSASCEGPRSMVTATVTAPLPLTVNTATSVCGNVVSTVSVTSTASNYDSYIWSPATNLYTDAAATVPYAGGSATVLYYRSATANTTTYTLTATNSVSGCANVVTTSRTSDAPVITAVATPSMMCSGSTSTLTASSVSSGTAAVGTGSLSTSTQGITPYGSNYEGSRQQYLIRASELQAANIYPGNLTSVAFSVTAQGTGAFSQSNFTIKMAHTANTALTNAYGTPTGVFTTVYGPATQGLPALGSNVFTFTTPFNWDGVSNILVDICHDNDPTATCTNCYSSSSTVAYTTTSFNSVWGSYNDDAPSCGVQAANTIFTYNTRPNMRFGGQVLNSSGAGLNWVWNPGGATTNTTTVAPVNTGTNPAVFTYTVTGTNAVTTCSSSAVTSITVNPVPTTPVTANSIQCGLGVPTASVSGGTSYRWYATPTSTAVIQSGAGQTYTTSISSTTSFYVSSFNGTCESPRAMLTASVTNPDGITAVSTSSAICPGQSFTLTAASTGTNNVYSYTWTATPATGSGIATSVTGATTVVMPTAPGTYNYLATASDAVCTTTAAVQVTLNAAPNVATSNTVICAGSSAVLTATSTGIGAGSATIGTNSLTDYTGGPYRQGSGTDNKAQWLFTAAELSAANIAAGNITAISFNVPAGSADIMNNFSVRIGTTTATSLTTTFDASATSVVYGPSAVSAATGINTYTFSAPFNWNGTSNIIIQVCHDVVTGGGGSTAITRQSIANRTIYSNVAGACAQTTGIAEAYRPVVTLAAQTSTNVSGSMNWVWNPGGVTTNTISVSPPNTGTTAIVQVYTVTATNPVTTCTNSATSSVTVNPVPSVTVAASSSSLCSGTSATLTASGATTYSWMPAGGTASVAVVSPTATTIYTVTGTSGGCSNTRTLSLNVSPSPTVIATLSPSVICAGATVSLTASGATTYSWMPNGSTSGTTTATPTVSTTYTVTGTSAGCTNTKTLSVTVNNVPTLTLTSTPGSILCTSGASATLTATGTSTAYAWGTGATTSTIVVTPTTTTNYTLTGTNSCGTTTAAATVSVGVMPAISAMASSSVICAGNAAVLTASATVGATYSWNTGASTMSISVSPSVTTTYTVTGTNACGSASATVTQSVSTCIGVEEMANGGEISIYPNPASDYVNIAIPANMTSANATVEVTDALGKLVMKENITTDVTTLRITKLEEGVYFFKVISNGQTIKVGKVVKH